MRIGLLLELFDGLGDVVVSAAACCVGSEVGNADGGTGEGRLIDGIAVTLGSMATANPGCGETANSIAVDVGGTGVSVAVNVAVG